jgi:hypothetical protein
VAAVTDLTSLPYSAHSLQAYVDCPRQFELNYLDQLKWPAVEQEPLLESERHMADGRRFHEMVHRDTLGLTIVTPTEAGSEDVARWWENYLAQRPARSPGRRFAEKRLVGSVMGQTLVAMCDLVVMDEDSEGGRCKARIYDWKTWRRRHSREWLLSRLQTRVYPYLLVQSGAALKVDLEPDDVEMVYWYAEYPEDGGERFAYSEMQYAEDESYLSGLIEEITGRQSEGFELTTDERRCTYCVYRSFCGRGDVAGQADDGEDESGTIEASNPLMADLDDYESIAF